MGGSPDHRTRRGGAPARPTSALRPETTDPGAIDNHDGPCCPPPKNRKNATASRDHELAARAARHRHGAAERLTPDALDVYLNAWLTTAA